MKSKIAKVFKILFFIAVIALILCCFYNIISIFRYGKQSISVTTSTKYYAEDNIEAIISVRDSDTDNLIKSNVKVQLLNSDGKKVKGVSEKYKVEQGESANVSLEIPDDIETGNYVLEVTSTSGIKKDTEEISISIVEGAKTNTVISFDKGIYKPGDDVNFRALVLSKKSSEPVEEEITISIYDGNSNKVYTNTAKTSEFGIVSGTFSLADEVNSGEYKLTVSTSSGDTSKDFTVNPYVTPQYEATVTTDKDSYVVGETATVTVNATYFFGEPVKNATITGTINDEEIVAITNENGEYTTTYELTEKGTTAINLQIVDTSNYYVEASKSISVGTDIFEIEVYPEYGSVIQGIDNDVYIITRNIDGTPVKTHTTITLDSVKKQVITDENGVGKATFTASELSSFEVATYSYEYSSTSIAKMTSAIKNGFPTYSFNITSEDMEGNIVYSTVDAEIEANTGTIIKTDSVKYNQGDDIDLTLNSATDITDKTIFVYKNDELIKMISTDTENVTINLDDMSGIIDFYVQSDNRSSGYYKKTIFIKPTQELNIALQTDSEEYEPGDTLELSFTTTDESGTKVDSALLVSILDEAVLSLAENDLSIDNIKMALEDVELTSGVTLADLYTSIIDNESETLLMSVLLKQSNSSPNLNTSNGSYVDTDEFVAKAVITGCLAGLLIIIFICLKRKKASSNVFVALVDCIAIFAILFLLLADIFYYDLDLNEICTVAGVFVIAVVAYLLLLYKQKDYIFRLIFELVFLPGVFLLIALIIEMTLDIQIYALLLFVPPLVLAIEVSRERKNPLGSIGKVLKTLSGSLCKTEADYLITYLLMEMFLEDLIGYETETFLFVFILCIIVVNFIIELIYNRKKVEKADNSKITINITGFEGIGALIGVVLILIVIVFITTNRTYDSSLSSEIYSNSGGGGIYEMDDATIGVNQFAAKSDISASMFDTSTSTSSSSSSSIADIASDIIGTFSSDNGVLSHSMLAEESEEIVTDIAYETENSTSSSEETEVNVRNVFLESLAFIPELVTSNGSASTSIQISDNITTWSIQTVGNTKDGNLGYATSSIKVFKEFFIDFSLPTNSVVSDKTSIPVTIYNYKDTNLDVTLSVTENNWSTIGDYTKTITVPAGTTQMVYIPIEILSNGSNTLRISGTADGVQDIVERTMNVSVNGFEKTNVVSSGTIENSYTQDFFTTENAIEGTRNVTVKIYPSIMSQAIEGIENILEMPYGCFEQVSSSLYPDILALNYMETTDSINEEIREKALEYIETGYQKLLTYEVSGETGGYSLYGRSPAETVLTAYGLMELTDLKEVYDVEDRITDNMVEFIFGKQNLNGSFDYHNSFLDERVTDNELAINSYIIWALSEVCPKDSRLEKSINYLEGKVDDVEDNYTLALMANIFINVNSSKADSTINMILDKIQTDGEKAYLTSGICDYWGSYGNTQTIQTTALASLALSKDNSNSKTNGALINFIISSKDTRGTWKSTQATVLALKAITTYNTNESLAEQTITITLNNDSKEIEIGKDELDIYEVTFENVSDENSISIDMKKGKLYYEIVEDYYISNDSVEENKEILVSQTFSNTSVKVNDVITQTIVATNNSENAIANGMVTINIPQGCSVEENSLLQLEYDGIIEKYEYNYGTINIYLRNWKTGNTNSVTLNIDYRASYPENITGGMVRIYDYYNPDTEGFAMPVNIIVNE